MTVSMASRLTSFVLLAVLVLELSISVVCAEKNSLSSISQSGKPVMLRSKPVMLINRSGNDIDPFAESKPTKDEAAGEPDKTDRIARKMKIQMRQIARDNAKDKELVLLDRMHRKLIHTSSKVKDKYKNREKHRRPWTQKEGHVKIVRTHAWRNKKTPSERARIRQRDREKRWGRERAHIESKEKKAALLLGKDASVLEGIEEKEKGAEHDVLLRSSEEADPDQVSRINFIGALFMLFVAGAFLLWRQTKHTALNQKITVAATEMTARIRRAAALQKQRDAL